jgi:catalase
MWNMSDRGIPRSYRMMEDFGVQAFLPVNDLRAAAWQYSPGWQNGWALQFVTPAGNAALTIDSHPPRVHPGMSPEKG